MAYLAERLKKDLLISSVRLNKSFFISGIEYIVADVLSKIRVYDGYLGFTDELAVKYLVYNNRYVYILRILAQYRADISHHYMVYKGTL